MSSVRKLDLGGIVLGRCPRCREGLIFPPLFSRSALAMHSRCPVCGLVFEREPGYFVGAMYVSYTLGVMTILPVALGLLLVAHLGAASVIAGAIVQTLLTMVIVFRYARVVWLYIDQVLDPR